MSKGNRICLPALLINKLYHVQSIQKNTYFVVLLLFLHFDHSKKRKRQNNNNTSACCGIFGSLYHSGETKKTQTQTSLWRIDVTTHQCSAKTFLPNFFALRVISTAQKASIPYTWSSVTQQGSEELLHELLTSGQVRNTKKMHGRQ